MRQQNTISEANDILELIFQDRIRSAMLQSSAISSAMHTSLVIIKGMADSLLRNSSQDPLANLQKISAEADRLLKILDAMTMQLPSELPQMQKFNLLDEVKKSFSFFDKLCLERGISITIEINSQSQILSDHLRFKSILGSLIQNAIESFDSVSGDQIKNITLHTHENEEGIVLVMSDTGQGMALETQKRIREEVWGQSKVVELKTGLGLALARKIAVDLDISLDFISEENRGTTFTLRFKK